MNGLKWVRRFVRGWNFGIVLVLAAFGGLLLQGYLTIDLTIAQVTGLTFLSLALNLTLVMRFFGEKAKKKQELKDRVEV